MPKQPPGAWALNYYYYITQTENLIWIESYKQVRIIIATTITHLIYDINNFFCSVAINPEHNAAACFSVPEPVDIPDHSFQFASISKSDVLFPLQHLDIRKSVGPDDSSSRFLKEMAVQIVISLTKIFNESLKSGNVPQTWKCSSVTSVHKSRQLQTHPSCCSNC